MKTARILIVEDDTTLLEILKKAYKEAFASEGFESVEIETAVNAEEATACVKSTSDHPYDMVSLDVNLGDPKITGIDVLRTIGRREAAWMVALLTGVESDDTLDDTVGANSAEELRKHLRRDAYTNFPTERLMVVEKPSQKEEETKASDLLHARVQQIVQVYKQVSLSRFTFKPIEVVSMERIPTKKGEKKRKGPDSFIEKTSLHWMIRYNRGEIRTLADRTGFRVIHHLLSTPGECLTPEQSLVIEPKVESSTIEPVEDSGRNPVSEYFEAQGIQWNEKSQEEQDLLIKTALSLHFKRYVELREWLDDDDLAPIEEEELNELRRELGALVECAETAYQRLATKDNDSNPFENTAEEPATKETALANELHTTSGGNYDRVRKGQKANDSTEAANFRKRWERVKVYLRHNGYPEFAEHLEQWVQPGGGGWTYNAASGVEWNT